MEPPLKMDHNFNLSLYLLSLSLFSIFVPAVLLGRNNSGSEFLTVGWQPHLSTWLPIFLLDVDSTSSLSPQVSSPHWWTPFQFYCSLLARARPPSPSTPWGPCSFTLFLLLLSVFIPSPDPCFSVSPWTTEALSLLNQHICQRYIVGNSNKRMECLPKRKETRYLHQETLHSS